MKNTTIVRNMIEDQKTICQTIKKDLRLNQLSSLKDTMTHLIHMYLTA